jgi:uncharacterized membrane protein
VQLIDGVALMSICLGVICLIEFVIAWFCESMFAFTFLKLDASPNNGFVLAYTGICDVSIGGIDGSMCFVYTIATIDG